MDNQLTRYAIRNKKTGNLLSLDVVLGKPVYTQNDVFHPELKCFLNEPYLKDKNVWLSDDVEVAKEVVSGHVDEQDSSVARPYVDLVWLFHFDDLEIVKVTMNIEKED